MALTLGSAIALPVLPATVAAASLGPYEVIAVPSQADAVRVGDVTGDGRADIVFTTGYDVDPVNDFHLFVMPQRPDGTLSAPISYATAGSYAQRPHSLDLGDVTGDGLTDVVIGLDRYAIQVFPGRPDGSLGSPTFTSSTDSTRIAIGDLNGEPGLDVAGIGWGSNSVTVFSSGGGALTAVMTYPARHGGWEDLEVGDVSGDGLDDLVVMSGQLYADPNISVLTRIPGAGFGQAVEYSIGANILSQGIGIGDITGDGRADVVASYGGNRPSSFIAVFAQTSEGTLAAPVSQASYDIPEPVEVGELDGDGRNDVVTLHGGWERAGIYRGQSDGTLAAETLDVVPYASHYNPQGLALGDVDGNGTQDIVEADYNFGIVILRNGSAPTPTVPGSPTLTSASPGDRSVTLAWTAPQSNGGSAITSFTATATPGGATCTVAGLGCAIAGLTNGAAYTFTVHATNVAGVSPESNPLAAVPRTVPSAPRNLSAKAGGSGVTLKWSPPSSTGGSPLTAYRIYRGAPGSAGTLVASVNAAAQSFVDTAAPRKVTSSYSVTAVNAAGEGARSNAVSVIAR
ncbi:MAG TPA: FG-GAP-like repeat-containing protein [Candidatus Limnocylindrales bacterium]